MTTFALAYHANRQHWAISAALVVLVHGVVASAIATWWIAIKQPEMLGGTPIVIELAPAPPAAGPQPAAIPAAPEQGVPNTAPYKPMEKIEKTIQERSGEDKTEQKPAGQPSVSMAPPQSADEEDRADVRTAPGGGAPQPGHSAEPIDIRMGDPYLSRLKKKPLNPSERQKIMMGRRMLGPSRYFAGREEPLVPVPVTAEPTKPNATGSAIRNAIGVLVPGPMGVPASAATNAIGVAATRTVRGANPVGAPAPNHPSASSIVKSASAPAASVVTIAQPSINGTRMIRPGAGTGVITGPAKSTGVINGTAFKVR
jgi:hypothetical protein